MKSIHHQYESKLALVFLLVAASAGVLLRWMAVEPIAVNYKYLMHTHSHIAMLGWMYFATVYLIKKHLIHRSENHRQYHFNFLITTLSVVGMMFSFPFTGYALVSIISSSLFILSSYHFCYLFFKDLKAVEIPAVVSILIKYSLVFLILSSFGPWSLAGIMASGNSGSPLYSNAIYFYLHFMYDGFFIFAILALIFYFLNPYVVNKNRLKSATRIVVISGFTTVLLSFLWNIDNQFYHALGLLVALFQFYGFMQMFRSLDWKKISIQLKETGVVFRSIVWVVSLSFIAKLLLQTLSSCPWIIGKAIVIRDFVIGYIHLVFLGVISLSLFAIMFYQFRDKVLFKYATWVFIVGIVSTETLLLIRGGFSGLLASNVLAYLLVVVSMLLVLGSALFYLLQRNTNVQGD